MQASYGPVYSPYQACKSGFVSMYSCRPSYVRVYSPHQTSKSGISVCPLSGMQARLCYRVFPSSDWQVRNQCLPLIRLQARLCYSVFPLIRLASQESVYAPYQACRPALDQCMPLIQHAGQAYNAPVYACYQDMLF